MRPVDRRSGNVWRGREIWNIIRHIFEAQIFAAAATRCRQNLACPPPYTNPFWVPITITGPGEGPRSWPGLNFILLLFYKSSGLLTEHRWLNWFHVVLLEFLFVRPWHAISSREDGPALRCGRRGHNCQSQIQRPLPHHNLAYSLIEPSAVTRVLIILVLQFSKIYLLLLPILPPTKPRLDLYKCTFWKKKVSFGELVDISRCGSRICVRRGPKRDFADITQRSRGGGKILGLKIGSRRWPGPPGPPQIRTWFHNKWRRRWEVGVSSPQAWHFNAAWAPIACSICSLWWWKFGKDWTWWGVIVLCLRRR